MAAGHIKQGQSSFHTETLIDEELMQMMGVYSLVQQCVKLNKAEECVISCHF